MIRPISPPSHLLEHHINHSGMVRRPFAVTIAHKLQEEVSQDYGQIRGQDAGEQHALQGTPTNSRCFT
jgi:hypothetical protein